VANLSACRGRLNRDEINLERSQTSHITSPIASSRPPLRDLWQSIIGTGTAPSNPPEGPFLYVFGYSPAALKPARHTRWARANGPTPRPKEGRFLDEEAILANGCNVLVKL
jgi:hypothetical protein